MVMNSRERVYNCLNFQQPDRPPVFASFAPEIEELFRRTKGINSYDLGVALGNDMVKSCVGFERDFSEYTNHPLADDKTKLDSFEMPDPLEDSRYNDFRMKKNLYGGKKYIIGSSQISIYEVCCYLRGFEQFMTDMISEPDYAEALMDKVMQFPLKASLKFIELGADMVWFGDDISTQRGMTMSADLWRKYFKPRYANIFDQCKKANPKIKIAYHSFGNCFEILSDMIEIGLDILNPLDHTTINPVEVKKRFGKNLVLFGGICVQKLMPYGTSEEVMTAVRKMKKECGEGGGYICAPAHHIPADTSLDNIMSFYSEGLKADSQHLPIPVRSIKVNKIKKKKLETKSQKSK